jgi:hypothetical protein
MHLYLLVKEVVLSELPAKKRDRIVYVKPVEHALHYDHRKAPVDEELVEYDLLDIAAPVLPWVVLRVIESEPACPVVKDVVLIV